MEYERYVFSVLPVSVKSITHCVQPAEFDSSQPHFHPYGELFFVMRGELVITEDSELTVRAGEYVFINANSTHRERAAGQTPCEYYVLSVEATAAETGPLTFRSFYNETAEFLGQAIDKMSSGGAACAAEAEALARLVAVKALTAAASDIEPPATAADGDCFTVKKFIDGNFASDIRLPQLAAMVCRSEEHLIRTFRREYGVSPMRYLKKKRIYEAEILLRSTEMDVSQIASLVGYNSAAHFAADFKASAGNTPSAYRKSLR